VAASEYIYDRTGAIWHAKVCSKKRILSLLEGGQITPYAMKRKGKGREATGIKEMGPNGPRPPTLINGGPYVKSEVL
jgi:hypothetical protein